MSAGRIVGSTRKSLAMGPSVRNLLSQYRLEAASISSTGPHNTVLKSDVLDYITRYNLQPNKSHSREHSGNATTTNPTTKIVRPDTRDVSRFARKYPSQQEIEVINAGGVY